MDGGRWQRVKEIFSAALEQDAGASHRLSRRRLQRATPSCAPKSTLSSPLTRTPTTASSPAPLRRARSDSTPIPNPISWIGRRVGDYRIVEEVGRGGMSEVYKGVRDDAEYHKEVAVKVLRRGYDTRALLKRFKVETQILATLDHPNIARLLDAGSTAEGLPYLVMDYIKGVPIDEYCRQEQTRPQRTTRRCSASCAEPCSTCTST